MAITARLVQAPQVLLVSGGAATKLVLAGTTTAPGSPRDTTIALVS